MVQQVAQKAVVDSNPNPLNGSEGLEEESMGSSMELDGGNVPLEAIVGRLSSYFSPDDYRFSNVSYGVKVTSRNSRNWRTTVNKYFDEKVREGRSRAIKEKELYGRLGKKLLTEILK